jgi:hypothetical protein
MERSHVRTRLLRMTPLVAGLLTLLPGLALGQEADPLVRADPDGKMTWYDARGLTIEGQGWTETEAPYDRLPLAAKEKVRPDVWWLSKDSAGLAVHFRTDAPGMTVRWTVTSEGLAMPHMPATGMSGVDLYRRDAEGKWRFVANGRPSAVTNEAGFPGDGEFLLYLPLYNGTAHLEIGIPTGSTLEPVTRTGEDARPVVFYGTSITQGGCASRPGMAATALVGRALDVPVINLGFSGNGLMEPELADLLAALDPRVYVLDCLWNMSPDSVRERVEPFVRRLREAHPDTPIVLAEDSQVWDRVPTEKGLVLREAYDRLVADGVPGLTLLPATGMLGTDGEGTVDGCHPNDLGMARQAEVFTRALAPLLGK